VYAAWTLLIVVLVAWSVWWFTLKDMAIRRVEAWTAAQKTAGAQVSYSSVGASGFPLRLTLTFEDPTYVAPGGGWSVSTPRAQLHINPSDLSLFIIEPRDTLSWTTRGASRTLTPRESAISIHLTNNRPDRLVVEGKNVAVTRNGAPDMTIGSFVAGMRADPRMAGDGQFTLDAQAIDFIKLPQGFEALGGQLQALNARVVIEKGAVLVAPSRDRLMAWKAATGAARIEGLNVEWGPAKLTATGRFIVDDQRRPEGDLSLDLQNPSETFAALSKSPTASAQAGSIYSALSALGMAPVLSFRNGKKLLYGQPIGTVEPIR
jgi:hypothetical protein